MAAHKLVSLAERYGQLSNLHDMKGIRQMVAENAIDVYGFKGRERAVEVGCGPPAD